MAEILSNPLGPCAALQNPTTPQKALRKLVKPYGTLRTLTEVYEASSSPMKNLRKLYDIDEKTLSS